MRQLVTSNSVDLTQCQLMTNVLRSVAGFGGMEHTVMSSISIFLE